MTFWTMLIIQVLVTALVVLVVLTGFWFGVIRPYLDTKVEQIREAADGVEPKVTQGVKQGVTEALTGFPEASVKESTRQFLKFGSGLFENGLSSFLGTAADLDKRSAERSADFRKDPE